MKKNIFRVGGALCLTFVLVSGICWPSSNTSNKSQTIKGPVLIDKLQNNDFNLQLIYSNIGLDHIEVFDVTSTQLRPHEFSYTSFTEGFISTKKNNLLLSAINIYRSLQNLEPIHYYYNYFETAQYDFVSLSNGLDNLYIIDRHTGEVATPSFDIPYGTEKQYIYHITEGDQAFYILAAKANSYEAFWYTLNKTNFEVTSSNSFTPPITAVKRNEYALDDNGTAYFVTNNSLYTVSSTDTYSLPLSFTPDEVYYKNGQLYAFSVSDLFLSYTIIGDDLQILSSGRVNLPNKEVSLVDSFLDGTTLYTLTYDINHPLYRNYLTLYDLDTNEMIYCLALKDNTDSALLGFLTDFQA